MPYARNFLLTKVKEPYICWIDNDYIFINDSLKLGKTILENDSKVGIVGGKRGNQPSEFILLHSEKYKTLIKLISSDATLPKRTVKNID